MNIKFKPDLIIYLYIIMMTPITFSFTMITIILIQLSVYPQVDDLVVAYYALSIMFVAFFGVYLILHVKYKYSINFTETGISIYDKYKGSISINYENVIKIEFIKTPLHIWPIFIFTEGNRLIIYYDDNGNKKIYGRKVYRYKIKKLEKSGLSKISYINLKDADKNLFKKN